MTGVPPPVDNPAAVHRGLLALARRRKADFNAILVQYAIERLIDRLSRSPHADSFVLKGAMLFRIWTGELQRPTKDVDFLGHGDPSPAAVAEAVTAIVSIDAKDGLRFDAASIAAQEIREEHDYDGVRVTVTAYLAHVPITVRMDIGFGDAVTPPATALPFPTLLGHDPPVIRAYPPETAVAEKVEAMCTLGIINSRMKDYCDLIAISRRFEIDGQSLTEAIRATFQRRGTPLPDGIPAGLSEEFAEDAGKQRQWIGYLGRTKLDTVPRSLTDAIAVVRGFVLPALAAASGVGSPPDRWRPSTGWGKH